MISLFLRVTPFCWEADTVFSVSVQRILTVAIFLTAVLPIHQSRAQSMGGEYDFTPRIRSYLQRPVSETDKYVEDVSVPQFNQEGMRAQMGRELLPEESLYNLSGVPLVLIDRTVDSDKYIVGAGDLVNIYLWGELDKEYSLNVSPEGFVLIPTVGPVQVADITLTEARERIMESVRDKYHGIEVTIYLLQPRQFRVYISGLVENPGMYSANAMLRVSDLLRPVIVLDEEETDARLRMQTQTPTVYDRQRGGLFMRSEYMTRGEKKGSSKRGIWIERGDQKIPVDLLRFEKLGDLDNNPYVTGGDHIHVPQYNGDIYIGGEVNASGIFEYMKGDTIADLVTFGGGLTTLADTSTAMLVRFSPDGLALENNVIDLYDAIIHNPNDPKYLLMESDRLFVQTKYQYKVLANVRLDGQFVFPGEYAVIPHKTSLSEIVESAGGFTEIANLDEARIVRPVTSAMRDLEYERLRRMLVADMSDDEYEYFKHVSRVQEGTVSIDFVKLFRDRDMNYDIMLEDGDQIFVPMKRDLVNVLGAVEEPGYVRVSPGQTYDYYIKLAGGFNWNAKQRSLRIVKAKTGQRLRPSKNTIIEGGDTIHVPEKKPIDYWQVFLSGTQLFANMATLIIIARNLTQ